MKPVKDLYNPHYEVEMGFGRDHWRLTGIREGESGPSYLSTPASLDEETMIVTTLSGSRYKLIGVNEKTIQQIKEDVLLGTKSM